MRKIYRYRKELGYVLVLCEPPDVPPPIPICYRRWLLSDVPFWPEDIDASREYLYNETLKDPGGEVLDEKHLNIRHLAPEDFDFIDDVAAACTRATLLPHLGEMSPEEIAIWVEANIISLPDIRDYLQEVSAAIVLLRDCLKAETHVR